MEFNHMDIFTFLFYLRLEQIDDIDDVGDLIIREVQQENENRVYANIPDLNEPFDDGGHGGNTTETPINDDHSSNSIDSIEGSVLPQVVVSIESSGSGGLPQDYLHVSVESSENETSRSETLDLLNSIDQKLGGVGKEEEDIQEAALDSYELFSSLNNPVKKESESNDGDDSAKKESKSDDENNGEDSAQDNLHERNEQNANSWSNMAFNNMDIDTWKVLFEQVDRDVEDLIIREVQEENENRFYADSVPDLNEPFDDDHGRNTIETQVQEENENTFYADNVPDLNEPFDDDHGRNTIETPINDDHSSNSSDSIESSGSGLPQDDLQIIEDEFNLYMDFELHWAQYLTEAALKDGEDRRRAYSYLDELFSSLNNSIRKEFERDDDNNDGDDSAKKESNSDDENNEDDGSQDNLNESNEQIDSLRFDEKLDIDQEVKIWLNIYQQLEGAIMELRSIKVPSIQGMDIELLKEEELLDPVHQRVKNLKKLIQDIEKEVALEDWKNRRRADSFLQELISSLKKSAKEESITEESDEENDSVIDEMYYSCDSDPWDAMSDISDDESCSVCMNSESSLLAKSPDFCVDNKVPSEKSTVESDGNESSVPLNSPEEIKHGDEMNSAWRNPIMLSSSSSDSDSNLNPSMESDMEDIYLIDDEFERTWEFINPKKVHSIPSQQQQKERSIKKIFQSYFG